MLENHLPDCSELTEKNGWEYEERAALGVIFRDLSHVRLLSKRHRNRLGRYSQTLNRQLLD